MIQIDLVREDVIAINTDVLILKHAQSFYGALEREIHDLFNQVRS